MIPEPIVTGFDKHFAMLLPHRGGGIQRICLEDSPKITYDYKDYSISKGDTYVDKRG